jgi:hypothetical protein
MPTVSTPRVRLEQESEYLEGSSDDDRSMEGESVYADVDAGQFTSHKLLEETDCFVLYGDNHVCGRDAREYLCWDDEQLDLFLLVGRLPLMSRRSVQMYEKKANKQEGGLLADSEEHSIRILLLYSRDVCWLGSSPGA